MSRNLNVLSRTALAVVLAGLVVGLAAPAQAFDIPVHMRITNGELRPLRATVYTRSVGFSPRALEQIAKANEAVDSVATGSAAYFHSERHFTDENFRGASQRLIGLRQDIISLVTSPQRDGYTARQRVGQALHTIQDFYAHSNWVERGNGAILPNLGKTTYSNPSRANVNCPTNANTLGPNGGGHVTSGYFVGFSLFPSQFGCSLDELPANKCFHGNYSPNCTGINKDLDAAGARQHGVTQNPHHGSAASLGREATRVFVQGILDELRGNDRALAALLDVRGTLGYVIDDTGSMGSSIAGVKSVIAQMLNVVSGSPEREPDNYLMVRFGDPDVGGAFITESAAQLQSAVGALTPHGGGDCPELSQSGLANAVNAALPLSHLYLFTDATAKDSSRVNQVIALAQSKGTQITYSLTGSCSPIDPAYIRGAAETGGQVFRVRPDEIPLLFNVMKTQLQGDQFTIARRRVDLGAGGSDTIPAPVDASTTLLAIAVSVAENNVPASHRLKVFRPDGTQVGSGDPGVTAVTLSTGVLFQVEAPTPGLWSVQIDGNGPFTATVRGNGPLSLSRFDFVEPAGDIHGGFTPVPGQPVQGAPALGEATLVGPYASAQFSFIDEAGQLIAPVALAQDYPTANPEHYLGESSVPAVPFRIAVTGVDQSGQQFRREYPAVYRAQRLLVMAKGPGFVSLTAGEPKQVVFTVENRGAPGSFRINASDPAGLVQGLGSTIITLGSNETAEVTVDLLAAPGTTLEDGSPVTLTATRTDAPTVFNSATLLATVISNHAPVCAASSATPTAWPPNGRMVDFALADLTAVTDADGDAISLALTSITQDEAVGRNGPDGQGVGTATAQLRAERDGSGDGRVYAMGYTATDARGASCAGEVHVAVPHDQGGGAAVDSGQSFDSTLGE